MVLDGNEAIHGLVRVIGTHAGHQSSLLELFDDTGSKLVAGLLVLHLRV